MIVKNGQYSSEKKLNFFAIKYATVKKKLHEEHGNADMHTCSRLIFLYIICCICCRHFM